MENYYVERTFSFQVNTFAKSGSVWENIQKCLKEELGEEGADTKLEKSDFTIFENKGVVNVFNAKNQLVAICEGTVINKNIACEGILINEEIGIWDPGGSTFWVGSIIKRDKKGNPIKVDPNEIIGEDLLYDLTISEKEALNGITKVFKYPRKNKNKLERKKIKLCIPKGIKTGTKLRIKNHGNTPINSSRSGDLYVLLTVTEEKFLVRRINPLITFFSYFIGGILLFTGLFPAISDLIRLILGREAVDFTTLDKSYPFRLVIGIVLLILIEKDLIKFKK